MNYNELDAFRRHLKVGDLVWYLDDYYVVSVRRVVAVELSLDENLQPDESDPRYTLSDYYRSSWRPVTKVSKYDDLWPYPEGRADVQEHLRNKARWLRDDADSLEDFEDTYWMDDALSLEVTGKTHAMIMAEKEEE